MPVVTREIYYAGADCYGPVSVCPSARSSVLKCRHGSSLFLSPRLLSASYIVLEFGYLQNEGISLWNFVPPTLRKRSHSVPLAKGHFNSHSFPHSQSNGDPTWPVGITPSSCWPLQYAQERATVWGEAKSHRRDDRRLGIYIYAETHARSYESYQLATYSLKLTITLGLSGPNSWAHSTNPTRATKWSIDRYVASL